MLTLAKLIYKPQWGGQGGPGGPGPGGPGGGGKGGKGGSGGGGGGGGSLGQGGPGGPGAHGRDSGTRGGGKGKGGGGGGGRHGPSPGKLGGKKGTNNTGSGPGGRNPGANRGGKQGKYQGPPIGTNPAAMTLQGRVDAANAARAANPAVTQGLSIDLKSQDIMGPPSSLANLAQADAPGGFRGVLAGIGDGFRQAAINSFGAEPGIEGYSEDGDYGYGYNSEYGQQLRAGNPNVRAKGNLSLAQQQAKAADYTEPGLFENFSIDTDGFFDGLGQKFGGFVLGRVGMALGGTFGPVGAILGGVLGNYIGKNMVGGDKEGEEGDDGKSSGIFGGLFSEGGLFSGTGYQASASDLGPGGAGESKPDDDKGIFANYAVGGTSGGGTGSGSKNKDGDITVPDGDDSTPDLTLEEYLKSLETDRAEAFANVRLQQRQALALQRISSRRYALGTSYRV